MYHKLVIFLGSISLQPFESYFRDYLLAIREAKDKGASHDYLRQVFIEFARKSFNVDPTDVELEKGIKGTKLRGSIDALYQDIVFEFKRDLKLEGEKGREELRKLRNALIHADAGKLAKMARKCYGGSYEGVDTEFYLSPLGNGGGIVADALRYLGFTRDLTFRFYGTDS